MANRAFRRSIPGLAYYLYEDKLTTDFTDDTDNRECLIRVHPCNQWLSLFAPLIVHHVLPAWAAKELADNSSTPLFLRQRLIQIQQDIGNCGPRGQFAGIG
jgi:hypothetical protein